MDEITLRHQNIAYVNSQIASALIELEAMKAENISREQQGKSLAYGYEQFMALIDRYQLGHNSVLTNFQCGL